MQPCVHVVARLWFSLGVLKSIQSYQKAIQAKHQLVLIPRSLRESKIDRNKSLGCIKYEYCINFISFQHDTCIMCMFRKILYVKKAAIFGAVSFILKIEHFPKTKMNPGILKSTLMVLLRFLSIQQIRDLLTVPDVLCYVQPYNFCGPSTDWRRAVSRSLEKISKSKRISGVV